MDYLYSIGYSFVIAVLITIALATFLVDWEWY